MNLSLTALFFLTVAQFPTDRGVIQFSASPDGKYIVAVKGSPNGDLFVVETTNGQSVSENLPSDFSSKPIVKQCEFTRVHWRSDSTYVAIDSNHDRHHVDFNLLKREHDHFVEVPFDWESMWNSAQPHFAGFGYPKFEAFLPHNRAKIRVTRWDGRGRYQYPADFIINLQNLTEVVSSTKLPAEALY